MAPRTYPMKIHDRWYDVTDFKHPGGPVMLSLGEGRDATALFEAHHPFTPRATLEKMLSKYAIDDSAKHVLLDKRDAETPFVWPAYESKDADGAMDGAPVTAFAEEVRSKVKQYFEGEAKRRGVSLLSATKATPRRVVELILLFCIFAATVPSFIAGAWWTLLVTPLTYWIFGVNTFHDASHSALSRDWRINVAGTYVGWWFSSPLEWYHQHVIGHHAYPNIPERDPDLYHNAKMERHTATLRWRPLHAHQSKTWFPIWWIGTFAMNFLKPIQMLLSRTYNRSVRMMPLTPSRIAIHVLGRIAIFSLCHVWPFFVFPLYKAFLFSIVPVGLVSLSFMVSSQMNHLTPPNVDVQSDDYYKHQVLTSHAFGCNSWLTFLFTGGLNYQIEHHLFPTVNHCHLKYLQPIVKPICAKYNVFYHESPTIGVAFRKYLEHMRILAKP